MALDPSNYSLSNPTTGAMSSVGQQNQFTPTQGGSGGGGGMDIGMGQIFQAGADTFNTAVNWIMFGQQMQQNAVAREESYDLAMILRGDTLRQQGIQNAQGQQGLNLQAKGMKLSEDQFKFNKDVTEKTLNRQEFAEMVNTLNSNIARNQEFSQYTRNLLGGK
jgi:hypothetical protein